MAGYVPIEYPKWVGDILIHSEAEEHAHRAALADAAAARVSELARPTSPAADRMRLTRQRRRNGVRCIPLEIRDDEIEALVKAGLLASESRNDRTVIAAAMGKLLGRLPPERWTRPPDKPGLVSVDLEPEFIDDLARLGWLAPGAARDNKALRAAFAGFVNRAYALSSRDPRSFVR